MKKILITNTVALNGGDAAILQAVLRLLREAFGESTEFIVYDNAPEVAKRYYPEIHFRKLLYWRAVPDSRVGIYRSAVQRWNLARMRLAMLFWKKSPAMARTFLTHEERIDFANYSNATLVVSTGGTYLVEHYSLAPRIFDYQLCLTMGRPLVFFTQSLGPFRNPSFAKQLREIFAKARLILLRDQQSLENLRALNLQAFNAQVSSDAVFALANPAILKQAGKTVLHSNKRIKVAISVRDWRRFATVSRADGMNKYKEAIHALIIHLVEKHNAEVVFISTCQGIPEYQFDDSKVAAKIFQNLPEAIQSHAQVNSEFWATDQLISHLEQFDVVIGTRMHFCILSLLAGVPVLPIAYEFKTNELFSRLGLGAWIQNIETLESEKLLKSFDEFLKALPTLRESLFDKVELERQRALESGAAVKTAMGSL